ncbi:hypothetical protein [Nocardioides sp. GXQ0305]|uniref:hypothetical protein n=1 Tax=Nocardioides sp. GXQ0305 TaxID=3423912 RepID=UPI003D7C81C5
MTTPDYPRTDAPDACLWCGDPLPARVPGKRGRPKVTHDGECARRHKNRRTLDNRIARWRREVARETDRGLAADRSLPGLHDAVTGSFGDDEPVGQSLADKGYTLQDSDPTRGLSGDGLLAALEEWEKARAAQNRIDECERGLREEERSRPVEEWLTDSGRLWGELSEEEQRERLRFRVEQRRARAAESPVDTDE